MAHLVFNGESADGGCRDCERLVGWADDYPGDPKELHPSLVPAFRRAARDRDKYLTMTAYDYKNQVWRERVGEAMTDNALVRFNDGHVPEWLPQTERAVPKSCMPQPRSFYSMHLE